MLQTPSVRLGGQDYLIPNSAYDIFAEPSVDNEPFVNEYTDPLKQAKLSTPNQASLNLSDLLLASSLNSLRRTYLTIRRRRS